jgi:hypothetical protein
MFTSEKEKKFFFDVIKSDKKILEYGSGESTLEISSQCFYLCSIEHQKNWYNKLITQIPTNCNLHLVEPNLPYIEGGDCGSYEEFKDYIEKPLNESPFDIILIDGRARVGCASICHKLSHNDTIVFIHDFQRKEYQEVLKYLDFIDIVETMAKFKIKK